MNSTDKVMHKDAELIDALGGPADVARSLGFEMPKGTQRVQNWKYRGIPPYTRVTRTDVFGGTTDGASSVSSPRALAAELDCRISKRALRARLGFTNDKQLATVLGLPLAQVEGWEEERALPALPEVLRLLGVQPAVQAEHVPADPDDDRIVSVEVA
ncbi:hypothetical protein ABB27_02560 [Stenotrophomonas terrae]|uniref:HTH cro/C1-type domain-containing protein n=1 Tax=Stenotrophomonas terrae TaxID=405446 RepID=A0A0R0CZD4_9GAMM|nr:hypothetical protein [Stenotrophomonas terrae]KRG71786.1 hypothetical protein ABB27_02560 [Stenotrophomonas terrae]